MDKLLLAATYYKLFLLNRDFHLLAGDSKRNTLELNIVFNCILNILNKFSNNV